MLAHVYFADVLNLPPRTYRSLPRPVTCLHCPIVSLLAIIAYASKKTGTFLIAHDYTYSAEVAVKCNSALTLAPTRIINTGHGLAWALQRSAPQERSTWHVHDTDAILMAVTLANQKPPLTPLLSQSERVFVSLQLLYIIEDVSPGNCIPSQIYGYKL